MSLFNPFAGLRHLGKVPRFLTELRSDLRCLFEADLGPKGIRPPRAWFRDEAAYATAVTELHREHMFRMVRQAVQKQMIRRTLWYRFGICYCLLGPIVVFFWIAVIILHLMAIDRCPAILDFPWRPIGAAAGFLIVIARILTKP